MASGFSVSGADDFLKLSKALKAAGKTELRKQLNKDIKKAIKPLIAETRAAALAELPKRGGLAKRVAKAPQRVQVRTGAKPGVSLVVPRKQGSAARASNKGTIRHPVFFHPPMALKYVEQKVPAGWFDDTTKAAAPEMQKAVLGAMQAIVRDIKRKV